MTGLNDKVMQLLFSYIFWFLARRLNDGLSDDFLTTKAHVGWPLPHGDLILTWIDFTICTMLDGWSGCTVASLIIHLLSNVFFFFKSFRTLPIRHLSGALTLAPTG